MKTITVISYKFGEKAGKTSKENLSKNMSTQFS